jgi:hypothetical protein
MLRSTSVADKSFNGTQSSLIYLFSYLCIFKETA